MLNRRGESRDPYASPSVDSIVVFPIVHLVFMYILISRFIIQGGTLIWMSFSINLFQGMLSKAYFRSRKTHELLLGIVADTFMNLIKSSILVFVDRFGVKPL